VRTKVRCVEQSMFPDLVADKPIGYILPSVFVGTNADLMAAVAPYYLTGSVLDVTYGEGKWWERFRPETFTFHDKFKVDGVDFTDLPEADGSIETVCFDPPYVPQGGAGSDDGMAFRDRFGLVEESTPWTATRDLMQAGLAECARVAERLVLAKCSDFVSGGRFHLGHRWLLDAATDIGLGDPHDLIVHHTGSGPGGHNIYDPVRARRHHSYLLVFTKGKR
jgi:hypothetical protein